LDPNLAGLPFAQYVAVACVAAGFVGIFCLRFRQFKTLKFGLVAIGLGIQFICNQHCLQPWAWQSFIIAVLLGSCHEVEDAKKWIARLIISIYLFSAIGKFDFQFVHSLGETFLDVLLGWIGQQELFSPKIKPWIVGLFPLTELLIGTGLCFTSTRKSSIAAAIALHLALIAMLSPLGLNHRPGVLIWNLLSIVLVVWLFGSKKSKPKPIEATSTATSNSKGIVNQLAVAFAIVVLVGPILKPIQLWDHWLAWGLYSPSNSRVELWIASSAESDIPDSLMQHCETSDIGGLLKVNLDQWSLAELDAPIYPQARFQKSVAEQTLAKYGLSQRSRLEIYGPSHPWTGKREKIQTDDSNPWQR
jgi:hypothetical protein